MAGTGTTPKRVTILGAGPSGLATAWELSQAKDPFGNPLYEITVYDMAWKPGGKCSSGRTDTADRRIVQNGTHYVFGVYFNMFEIVRQAYALLNGNSAGTSHAHANWGGTDEFNSRKILALKDSCAPPYFNWTIPVPCRSAGELPDASASPLPGPEELFDFLLDLVRGFTLQTDAEKATPVFVGDSYALRRALGIEQEGVGPSDERVTEAFQHTRRLARRVAASEQTPHDRELLLELQKSFERLRELMRLSISTINLQQLATSQFLQSQKSARSLSTASPLQCQLHRFDCVVDFAFTLAIALLVEGVLFGGQLLRLDQIDARQWLESHGLGHGTLHSPITLAWYDAIAAYAEGDANRPSLSAAAFLQTVVPAVFLYRGCFIYQMVGEVGENFAGPIYHVLKDRGVKFRWMHRVTHLTLSSDQRYLDRVEFELPVHTDAEAQQPDRASLLNYEPVIQFPLSTGEMRNAFRETPGAPFEHVLPGCIPSSAWYVPTPTPNSSFEITRNSGTTTPDGYDILVFALPHTVIPAVAHELVAASSAWDAVSKVPSVETRSMRLWLRPDLHDLEWDGAFGGECPVLAGFRDQFFVWEDSGQQLAVHTWPSGGPKSIATVFAPHPAPASPPARGRDLNYVLDQLGSAITSANAFLTTEAARLWLGVARGTGMDFGQIVIPPAPPIARPVSGSLPSLVAGGFVSANCGPLERYVHAAPGTYRHRLDPFASGFQDFFVAGDWVKLWPAVGNMEQAVISGRIAGLLIQGITSRLALSARIPNFPGFFLE